VWQCRRGGVGADKLTEAGPLTWTMLDSSVAGGAVSQVNSGHRAMGKNPILDLPLSEFMRSEIALPLQHVLKLYTVGSFLNAWRNPKNHRSIEQVFDTPQQARHAVAVCAAWLGVQSLASQPSVSPWWIGDQPMALSA
jgi:hypothetical protein